MTKLRIHNPALPRQRVSESVELLTDHLFRYDFTNPSTRLWFVYPDSDSLQKTLPLHPTRYDQSNDQRISSDMPEISKAAIRHAYHAFDPNEAVINNYWAFDTAQAKREQIGPEKVLYAYGLTVPETISILALSSFHIGVKEGALRDMINRSTHRSPVNDAKNTSMALRLVHAAFVGINSTNR